MSYRMLLAAGLALAACDMTPGAQPSVAPTREAQPPFCGL